MKVRYLYQCKNGRHNILHFSECHHLKRSNDTARVFLFDPKDILSRKYPFCQCCSPVSVMYRKKKKSITRYAEVHHQKVISEHGMLTISNGYSKWLVVPANDSAKAFLYHKNMMCKPNEITAIEGYHYQLTIKCDIQAILAYIVGHDKHRKKANAEKRAEQKQLEALVNEAAASYYKKQAKHKPKQKHYTAKEHHVITADTSNWDEFLTLFKTV